MIQLQAILHFDPTGNRAGHASGRNGSRSGGPRFYSEILHHGLSMMIEDDRPIDPFIFPSPEVSVICRADLLDTTSHPNGNLNDAPAAHIASLYLEQGDDFARNLRGTFAIIVFDHRDGALKAWIDHFGAQRLVYTESSDSFAISTDLRMLPSSSGPRPEIDSAAIAEYLQYSCIPAPRTIYRNCFKLQPGHLLTCTGRRTQTRSYWDMSYPEAGTRSRSEEDWARGTFDAIRSAVELNLTGLNNLNEVGCFLSGGTDSSSVSGLVGELTGARPRTFSIGFDDPRYNETRYARVAAETFGADHHEYFVTPDDVLALLEKATLAYDEPFGNSSIVPTYYCAQLAAQQGVTHLLAGDGGDELFGGNSRYVADRAFQRYSSIPAPLRRFLIQPMVSLGSDWIGTTLFKRATSYVRRSNIPLPDRHFSYSLVSSVPAADLFNTDHVDTLNCDRTLEVARRHFSSAPTENELNRWLYLDLKMIIADNDLRKVTTMSGLAGVTARYPLLDPSLAEFTGTIPSNLKIRRNQLRYVFKKAMKGMLPPAIVKKQKHGFGLPFCVWLGEHKPLREFTFDVLGSESCRQRGYFRPDIQERSWGKYAKHPAYYGEFLWHLLMLELWHIAQPASAAPGPDTLLSAIQVS